MKTKLLSLLSVLSLLPALGQSRTDSIEFRGQYIKYDVSLFLDHVLITDYSDSITTCPGIMKQYILNKKGKGKYAASFVTYMGKPMTPHDEKAGEVLLSKEEKAHRTVFRYRSSDNEYYSREDYLDGGKVFLMYQHVREEDLQQFDTLLDSIKIMSQ